LTVTGASIASVNAGTATLSGDLTLNGGTANGVLYLNGSKVATSGSALVFDGSKLGIGATPVTPLFVKATAGGTDPSVVTGERVRIQSNDTTSRSTYLSLIAGTSANSGVFFGDQDAADVGQIRYLHTNDSMQFYTSSAERMRLDTSGNLGIGTTSPASRLDVRNTGGTYDKGISVQTSAAGNIGTFWTSATDLNIGIAGAHKFTNFDGSATRMTLDSSGNLGLGVTPSAFSTGKAMQIGALNGITLFGFAGGAEFGSNFNFDSSYKYTTTGASARYTTGGGTHAWYIAPSGTAGNAITFTQAMTLDASGRLGIGTTSPSTTLHVKGAASADATLTIETNANNDYSGILSFSDAGGSAASIYYSHYYGNMSFFVTAGEAARITSAGEFLVGTTDITPNAGIGVKAIPAGRLHLVSSASTTSSDGFTMYSTGAAAYRFYVQWNGTINATNTTITGISDQRLKENIQDLDDGLDAILALKPRKFDWKEGKGKDIKGDRGWIAQEFEQVFPDMISEWKEPAPEGEEPYKAVRADLIPVLVKAMQQQQAMIEELKAKVAQLEAR
jgi:hypothetical protein